MSKQTKTKLIRPAIQPWSRLGTLEEKETVKRGPLRLVLRVSPCVHTPAEEEAPQEKKRETERVAPPL